MKSSCKKAIFLATLVSALLPLDDVRAQAEPGNPSSPPPGVSGPSSSNLEARFKRQHARINQCLREGTMTNAQAAELKKRVDDLYLQYTFQMQANGGKLKPEQCAQAEAALNQTNQLIRNFESAGTSVPQGAAVLGPDWTPGKDGAQKPASLLQKMKREERRELRQERQSNLQKIEQQQLDYEKQMIPSLGDQRRDIMDQKKDLDDIRKEAGAN